VSQAEAMEKINHGFDISSHWDARYERKAECLRYSFSDFTEGPSHSWHRAYTPVL